MCTCNGQKFLQEQLDSLLAQNRLPDELVVTDDASSDRTMELLERYQAVAPFEVTLVTNPVRLGPAGNFEKAISLCNGDFIALSDQDDVWMPDKLRELEDVLMNNKECPYVFSDALVVDESLNPLGYTMWNHVAFNPRRRETFLRGRQLEVLLKRNVVTGATLAFRAKLRHLILPIPQDWIHDAWIALIASAAVGRGLFIEKPLLKYRQHTNQAVGGRNSGLGHKIRKVVSRESGKYPPDPGKYFEALERLQKHGTLEQQAEFMIRAKIRHLEKRKACRKAPFPIRLAMSMNEALHGRYHVYSAGWKSLLEDLLVRKENEQ